MQAKLASLPTPISSLRMRLSFLQTKKSLSHAKFLANRSVDHWNDWLTQQRLNNPELFDNCIKGILNQTSLSRQEKKILAIVLIKNIAEDMGDHKKRFKKAVKTFVDKDYLDWSDINYQYKTGKA